MNEHVRLTEALLPHVLAAGAVIMKHFRDGVAVETKAGGSPVTAADRQAEAILLAALADAMPGIPVIAEEMAEGRSLGAAGPLFLLVDPLDGTREFVGGRTDFTVNVGLIRDGRPDYGLIYAPALSRLYLTLGPGHAVSGELSSDAEPSAARIEAIAIHRIGVRSFTDGEPLAVSASRSHASAELETWLQRITIAARVDVGSSLKFCQVAAGETHVYPRLGPTMEWDTAAGHAILLAGGGVVTDLDGTDLRYGKHVTGYRNPSFIAASRRSRLFYEAGPSRP